MSEKRFKLSDWCGEQNVSNVIDIEKQTHLINVEVVELLNEQQATIKELEKNFDNLVEWASEIAKRNVRLDERIGELQRENEQLRKELDNLKSSSVKNGKVVR